jgi:Phospholipase_D-nuclease N-terminal
VRFIVILLPIVLAVYALVDCVQTRQTRGLPKPLWLLVILVLPFIGPLAWLFGGHNRGWQLPSPPPARRPVAPDDDPDFLRRLRDAPPPRKPDPDDDSGHK